ncbi:MULTISPECIES: 2-oxoacid:acceptor oxidoreductase family protein [Oscillospiraceae]|jgi:pyruvate ferredoxin oxidoreductase gamma subunit|uniref:2-oxoacid:acceptor oxidoreductase family protein n=1 Tax=Oscillospiraceae TaxID=216572 RepID=UPI0003ADDD2D|nr:MULTISPECIES: 2-oxoacid:acceptor oxidoreductase family protein [unclassified Oscillibacter]ERK56621.1 2-oxoacid:acceptor oxidoreductase, gamma subunit, pyruvate/2-ketoisovalerate family [Oscillibacter sp. KLE 1745]ERK64545.1 2-oxoacid:acceptor oxidoreductase, gamma subunit, pyruvate/2-ketoisovalerate family [Oscillibacter sp. KLE 1728]MBE5708813.1 pyruvate ferredoxin oxidoreductase [Oscillibacter sp.]
MTEIRWHGRGGLGAFTAARLLGNAASIYEGKYALAFPSFGPERRGAPVFAFTRIDTSPITDRSEVVECDCAIVLDDTLFGDPVKNGLKPGATVIVNTTKDAGAFAVEGCKVVTVDATGLALEILGRPITNVPLLGALIAATDMVSLASAEAAIDDQLAPKLREKNKKLLNKAFQVVKEGM